MADSEAKKRLFDVLDRGAFQPVLNANEQNVPENKRDKLKHVKDATARERERFQDYDSAEEVYRMYRDDLTSENARDVNRDLRDLDLPILADCREQVENVARETGIR